MDLELSPTALHQQFAGTPFGQQLADQLRFNDPFRGDAATEEEWRSWLGPDVNILEHGLDTYRVTRWFIDHSDGQFDADQIQILGYLAVIHDWSEAITGDLALDDKNVAYETAGIVAYEQIIPQVIGEDQPRLRDFLLTPVKAVLIDTGAARQGILAKAFNAIEKIGYLQTALLAWKRADKLEGTRPETVRRLRWITYDVIANNLAHVVAYAKQFSAAEKFLEERQAELDTVMSQMPGDTLSELYPAIKRERKIREYRDAVTAFKANL